MKLTSDQIKHVAKLANLPLTPDEEEKYSDQLSKILEYVEQLNQVDTSDVESTFNVTGQSNVMREDETTPSLSQEEALSNAPRKKDSMFVTKGVFEEQ
ncbi:MAG: Asp-tRNA(Asn)/Glu-tRNA(Gln) amidotransferase subunit GatC [Candidatus Daviesbacteria bacterium]|nr:Asp-tRNA(Asn)/Glu-tRNA(Gln) amidotransferase subunit GatC [Candidatus Daviesbacteria bacterium]